MPDGSEGLAADLGKKAAAAQEQRNAEAILVVMALECVALAVAGSVSDEPPRDWTDTDW